MKCGFTKDVSRPHDAGQDASMFKLLKSGLEAASDHTFLDPDFSLVQAPVSRQAGQFGTGSRPTGGSIISAPRAENKIPPRAGLTEHGSRQLHMVDDSSILSGDPMLIEMVANGLGVARQGRKMIRCDRNRAVFSQEKPITAPGDITCDASNRGTSSTTA